MPKDQMFLYADDAPSISIVNMNSMFFELGERSYMKESLGLQILREAGVAATEAVYVHMRLNGQFWGLVSLEETMSDSLLERNGIPAGGPLYKSLNGEMSNLRWDVTPGMMPTFYELESPRDAKSNPRIGSKSQHYPGSSEWAVLQSFTWALGGGGPVPRSKFVMEHLDLPQMVNLLATQLIINNQDRCTKNFYVYLNPETQQWLMLPWDLDAAIGQDNGLGGKPGDKYCVLACEQWNSPLYCDSEHSQDQQRVTPWGTITVALDAGFTGGPVSSGSAVPAVPAVPPPPAGTGRRALQQVPIPSGNLQSSDARLTTFPQYAPRPVPSSLPAPLADLVLLPPSYPKPNGWVDPDRNRTGTASPVSAPGTYNHMIDAVMDVNATRLMVMRRVRTLAEYFLGANGQLAQAVNAKYAAIRSLAIRDAALWQSGIDVDRGYKQIVEEYIPVRYYELTTLYGPQGSYPLIPGPQPPPSNHQLLLTLAPPGTNSSAFQVSNPSTADTLDISGWKVVGPQGNHTFAPGTVLPPGMSALVVEDVQAALQTPRTNTLVLRSTQANDKKGGSKPNKSNSTPSGVTQLLDTSGTVVDQK